MMPAAKHGDPQMGVDIHLCVVPPSPSPVPLPTPHMSIIFDPFDYVPKLGATVTVCGMKRAVAGTAGKAVHIPPGFPFAPKIPDTADEVFMGSATVVADGNPFSFLAVPVLSCQVSGMPSPPRPKQQEKKLMLLPTTVNVAIPTNVFVGGPPTISLMGMAFKFGFAALGRFAKSSLFRRMRQKLFGKMKNGFLKCVILRAEPVDITTGEVSVDQEDFVLRGRIPLQWTRSYASNNCRAGACGYGWETPADIRLEIYPQDGSAVFLHPGAPAAVFTTSPQAEGHEAGVLELWDGALLSDHGDEFQVRTKADHIYHFNKLQALQNQDGAQEYPICRISDLSNNWLEFERSGPRLVRIRELTGRCLRLISDQIGRICQIALHVPESRLDHVLVEYNYDTSGDLIEVRDALLKAYRFAYDQHHMIRHTDRNGLSFYYEYEIRAADWRVVHTWGDGGLYNYRFDWFEQADEVRINNSLDQVSVVTFDDRGLPVRELDPLGGVTTFEYDEVGRTISVVDQDEHRTSYDYDERGNLVKLTRADGSSISTRFSAENKALCIRDPNGNDWQQDWNSLGQLIRQRGPLGATISYTYDYNGRLIAITDALGCRTTLEYDDIGNVIKAADPYGNSTRLSYDLRNNCVARKDASGQLTLYSYDQKDRLTKVTFPGGSELKFSYNPEDKVVSREEANGAVSLFEYTGLGEVAMHVQPDGCYVRYVYDTEERLKCIVNQRGEMQWLHRDTLGRVTEEVDYWGQSRRYLYSRAGRLLETSEPSGQVVCFETDALGRVTKKVSSQGCELFEYDANGNVIACENASVRIERIYDQNNRLTEERQGNYFTVSHEYDRAGNRLARITAIRAGDRVTTNYVRYRNDPLGTMVRLEVEGFPPFERRRNLLGLVESDTFGAGIRRSYGYTIGGRLAYQSTATSTSEITYNLTYHYDSVGNLVGRDDSRLGAEHYEYDSTGILKRHSTSDSFWVSYPHDTAGDRLITSVSPKPQNSDNSTWQRVGQWGDRTYSFDRAGNVVEFVDGDGSLQLVWSADHRLVASKRGDQITTYTYDPFGRRIQKKNADNTTIFLWDGNILIGDAKIGGSVEGEILAGVVREWIYQPTTFVPLAVLETKATSGARKIYYFETDMNGCPIRLTDGEGVVLAESQFQAWGQVRSSPVKVVQDPLRLQGQYEDEETGLYYNHLRYYDPVIGQFISQDPLGLLAGDNPYRFAPNVFGWIDPLGLSCTVLYHYTDEAGMHGIVSSKELHPSLKSINPRDVRFGEGQYLSDILPGTMTNAQLSRAFIGQPFQGSRFTHYVAIDVTGLNVVKGRAGVFVVPGTSNLDLTGRILGFGRN